MTEEARERGREREGDDEGREGERGSESLPMCQGVGDEGERVV